jgi:hypothetical protein
VATSFAFGEVPTSVPRNSTLTPGTMSEACPCDRRAVAMSTTTLSAPGRKLASARLTVIELPFTAVTVPSPR